MYSWEPAGPPAARLSGLHGSGLSADTAAGAEVLHHLLLFYGVSWRTVTLEPLGP